MNIDHHESSVNSLLYCLAFFCFCAGVAILGFLGIEAASYAERPAKCVSSIRSDELPQPQAALTDFERKLLGK